MWTNAHKWVVRYSDEKNPDLSVLQVIIEQEGIDILTQNTLNSLLHFACLGESTTVLSYLLQRCTKALVNHKNSNNETPLHWAVKSSSTEAVKLLLSYGASPKLVDNKGNSILHIAAESGNIAMIKLILRKKLCPIDTVNFGGLSPLCIACVEEEYKIIKYLVRHGSPTLNPLRICKQLDNAHARKIVCANIKNRKNKNCIYFYQSLSFFLYQKF